MKNIIDFIKRIWIIALWTVWYFFIIWAILKLIFNFDMFSVYYWWKFFHATFHGFGGFVFCFLVYGMIPIYIVTTIITWRKKELIIPIPFVNKILATLSKIFSLSSKSETKESTPETTTEKIDEPETPEYPADLPPELRVPFMRAKNRMPLTSAISVYNKTYVQQNKEHEPETISEKSDIPIPMDFDISDTINEPLHDSIPQFTDINFDVPIATEKELENNTTKYLKDKNIDFETYHDFVATEKFVIYEHNDEDFWIMDGDSWFAAGKQKDSPVSELIDLAKQNKLTPIIYLHSQNIMDVDNIINKFESLGIRVVKKLDELN